MTRLSYLQRDELDPVGQQLWDQVIGTRGGDLVDEHGALMGPFNAFVHAPEVGTILSALGAKLRFGTSIDPRLTELAIITVGCRWKAEFEWWAHARMARKRGVAEDVVAAIGHGDEPSFTVSDERTVYTFARELATGGQVSAPSYTAARELLGERGLVELVSLCGYYTLVSYVLNAFQVALPPGVAAAWGGDQAD